MAVKLSERKKNESINATMTLPISDSLKERYERVKNELHKREYDSLHTFTRERISLMLDDIERQLSDAG